MLPSEHPAKKLCSAASITTAVTPMSNTKEHKSSPELKSYNYKKKNDFKVNAVYTILYEIKIFTATVFILFKS